MIRVFCWNDAEKVCTTAGPEVLQGDARKLCEAGGTVWIDLENPTPEEETLVFRDFFHVHALTLEDATKPRREPDAPPHFPKVEEFPDYLFVVVNPLVPNVLAEMQAKAVKPVGPRRRLLARPGDEPPIPEPRASTQLSIVLTKHLLITHHYEAVEAVERLRVRLAKHDAQAGRGPDYLCHLILDEMVDQYAPVLDHFDSSLDEIELRIFSHPTPRLLMRLVQLKRQIILLRKTLIYEREVLARLCRGEFALIENREMAYYRNVYDHLVRFTELIESSREMVTDLMGTHLAAASNKLNEIMKVLTILSTVILPMTLVAGIYGMNFEFMPELHWKWGYVWALGLMVLVGGIPLAIFKWKKWIRPVPRGSIG